MVPKNYKPTLRGLVKTKLHVVVNSTQHVVSAGFLKPSRLLSLLKSSNLS